MYLILAKNDYTFWYKSVISSVEVYDKHTYMYHNMSFFIISYPFISPRSYIIP